jgi:hypothetical protein
LAVRVIVPAQREDEAAVRLRLRSVRWSARKPRLQR